MLPSFTVFFYGNSTICGFGESQIIKHGVGLENIENGEHGKERKHQPVDFKHSISNSKHFMFDSKQCICQLDYSKALFHGIYGDS